MTTVDLPMPSSSDDLGLIVGKSKIFPPLVALAFPLAFVLLLIGGFIRTGFDLSRLAEHGVLLAGIVPGALAMFVWVKRYTGPALRALANRDAICSEVGQVVIYGHPYKIVGDASISYDQSYIVIRDRQGLVAKVPGFFIKVLLRAQ
jgi:hypothetical protein